MPLRAARPGLVIGGSMIIALAGCGSGGATSPAFPDSHASQTASAGIATPTVDPSASDAMPLRVGCSDAVPCRLSAGRWVLTGQYSFILGMELALPTGWESREQDAGEFNLFPLDHPDDHIFMVKDIAAVTTDGSFEVVRDVPRTVEGLTQYWRNDSNLVVSPSEPTTIAGGIDAITYVITVSSDARFADPGCPVYPLCADFFTDPRYWEGPYGVGAPAAVRMYLATIGSGDETHVFVIGLEGKDEAALERLTEEAAPIIASIRLPDRIRIW